MPTIRDVARLAGVAPITVSRVINNSGYVSAETRKRVTQAIEELGYVPNRLARGLRLKRTHTLALVVTDVTNPFWTTVARGVEDAANDAGFSVILCNTDESEEKQERYLGVLLEKQVDGIIVVPARSSASLVEWIESHKMPIVVLDRRIPCDRVHVVRGDSEGGAYQLVKHLISLGHRCIVMLSGPRDVSTAIERVAGYRRAMAEAGLVVRPEWVVYGEFSQESGYKMARQVISSSPRPTALFAANNFIAIGALRALREANLQVPDDMSVVTFDDFSSGLIFEPFLTVADQPAYEMGQKAVELLLTQLSSSAQECRCQEVVMPVRLSIRRSSSQPAYECQPV